MAEQRKPIAIADIAWLAGLLEGEGSFFCAWKGSPRVSMSMTDEDVVYRAVAISGAKYVGKREFANHYKTQFVLQICGHRAVALMMTVYTFMGIRRREKIKECLARWRLSPYRRQIQPSTLCPHSDRKHYAHGLCRTCYAKNRYVKKADRAAQHAWDDPDKGTPLHG